MEPGDSVVADVIVDGRVAANLDYKATKPGLQKTPAVVFALPAGLKRFRLKGKATTSGKATAFDNTWEVRDMAPFSAPLYDMSKPWIERARGLAAKLDGAVVIKPVEVSAEKKPAKVAFADLERALGAPLPPAVKVLGDWKIDISDSYFLTAADMRTVTNLLRMWGYKATGPDGLDRSLSPAVRARYDRSLAVFVEVGDGIGMLGWDPAGVTRGERPGIWGREDTSTAQPGNPGDGVWFWLHEEHLVEPKLLLDDHNRPLPAEAAMTLMFERLALSDVDPRETEDELLVDSSHPRPNMLQLHFDERLKPLLMLRSYDRYFGM